MQALLNELVGWQMLSTNRWSVTESEVPTVFEKRLVSSCQHAHSRVSAFTLPVSDSIRHQLVNAAILHQNYSQVAKGS